MEEISLDNLFSGLEAFGLDKLSGMDIYDKEKENAGGGAESAVKHVFSEADNIYDKTYTCPVCDHEFKSKAVKSGKVKLDSLDSDLRPIYQNMDPLKYDVVVCPICGYAALTRFYKYVTSTQADLIKKNISMNFRGLKESGDVLSYDEAIVRHKLALLCSVVKKAKTSERAYTCIKTAWIIRGKAEKLDQNLPDYNAQKEALEKEELDFIAKAYDGFCEAFSKESFPLCGMDETTMMLMLAELSRRLGKYDESSRWVSQILISRDANERIKSKAREIKELLQKSKNSQ